MIARLFMFVLTFFALVAVPSGLVVLRLRARAAKKRLGERNAKLLKEKLQSACSFCSKDTDPAKDAYDERLGWYHPACYIDMMN